MLGELGGGCVGIGLMGRIELKQPQERTHVPFSGIMEFAAAAMSHSGGLCEHCCRSIKANMCLSLQTLYAI